MSVASPFTLERVHQADAPLRAFLRDSYHAVFAGRVAPTAEPADLAAFTARYGGPLGCLLLARDAEGRPLGCIGYRPYDHRFPALDYRRRTMVEVVRLYVVPAWRRQGLGAQLFQALLARATAAGADGLYLHTHPFLPGAETFWLRQGFRVIARESAAPWYSIHLERGLAQASAGPRVSR